MENQEIMQNPHGEESNTFPLFFLFLLGGVAAGSLFINIAHPFRSSETDVLQFYMLEQLKKPVDPSREHVIRLLILRSRVCLFLVFAGLTPVGKAVIRWCMGVLGFLMGAAVSMSLLCLGIRGMGMILAAIFPHGIFYGVVLLVLSAGIYEKKKSPLYYFSCFVAWILGIIAEVWLQPLVFSWVFTVL